MGLARSQTITLVVALATLSSNVFSSVLFSQLPDDPYHLASNFRWYLHFANVLSVFGFIGSVRQHALSIAVFSNYLLLDTVLCAIPRFILLSVFQTFSSTVCAAPPPSPFAPEPAPQDAALVPAAAASPASQWERMTSTWTPAGCFHIVHLVQLALAAGLVASTVLQFVGALCVREYARALWIGEMREEAAAQRCAARGVPVVDEYADEPVGAEKLRF